MRITVILVALLPLVAHSQASRSAFEVATVKVVQPVPGPSWGGIRGGPRTSDPGRITINSSTLKSILRTAYGLQNYQVSGPKWLEEERYEIIAKVPVGTTREQSMMMLQNLLAERFSLKLRLESREMPVYYLKVGKNGHKLTPVEGEVDDDAEADFFTGPRRVGNDGFLSADVLRSGYVESFGPSGGRITVVRQPIKTFADRISNRLDRPVLDGTGLQGLFSFVIYYAPAQNSMINSATDDVGGVSIFSAIPQQLGLQLEPAKGPVKFLVVESGERVPADN